MRENLLQKYGGLVLNDIDNNMIIKTISKHKLKWVIGCGRFVVAESPEYDSTNHEELEDIQISEDLLIILLSKKKSSLLHLT